MDPKLPELVLTEPLRRPPLRVAPQPRALVEPLPRLPLRVAPYPNRHRPEGDLISFRLCREEGLVFGTRSIHQTQ